MIKLIKTAADYEAALERLDTLVARGPEPDSPEGEQLELLGVLVEEYERARQPAPTADAIDAVRFRMEQLGLRPRDLIPFVGSRSKVSEVLARKRPLTLPMIRALHEKLGIPTDLLVRRPAAGSGMAAETAGGGAAAPAVVDVAWERFPIADMVKRGWLPGLSLTAAKAAREARDTAATVLAPFFAAAGGAHPVPALFRQGADHVRGGRAMDEYALAAWTARLTARAAERVVHSPFAAAYFDDDAWLDEFVRLSRRDDGPRRAIDALASAGVVVVVEPHLPKTQLDGAAFRLPTGRPVIGLTLRHDRVDNFWFTLLHECAHVVLHLGGGVEGGVGSSASTDTGAATAINWEGEPGADAATPRADAADRFYDDLDTAEGLDTFEHEADEWAGEILIPDAAWHASAVPYTPTPPAVAQLAEEIGVADAVVAGRARFERKNYRILNALVGHGAVRRHFPDVRWPE